jgi:hypothetical protein
MTKVMADTILNKTGACTDSTRPCDGDVESMIFSMNLYSYLRYQIPTSDPNFENVTKLFTPEGVTNRTVDPTMYFYYKQPIYIPNLYSSIRDKLRTAFVPAEASEDQKSKGATRERILMLNINNKMQDLNGKLTRLHNLASGKVKVGTYLVVVALVVFVFAVVLLGLFYAEAQPFIAVLASAARTLANFIWNSALVRLVTFWRKRDE